MSDDPIEVVAHDQHWAEHFAIVERPLRVALAPFVVDIEHIGSTAVPGLAANRAVSPDPRRLPGDDRAVALHDDRFPDLYNAAA